MWSAISAWFGRILRRPIVRHGIKSFERFSARLGWQFAGALTYFSLLAVVPILMVAFSVAGFVLANRPETLQALEDSIASLLPASSSITDEVNTVLNSAIDARLTVGIIGLLFALYTGISWMGNLRSAIQAMWRPDFDSEQEIAAEPLWRYYLKNLGYLVVLGLGVAVSLALTTLGTTAQSTVLDWLGLSNETWVAPLVTAGPIVLATIADTGIFMGIYWFIPPKAYRPRRKPLIRGAITAAVGFEVLKFGLTYLLPQMLTSHTAKIFGPIIGLLIFFNATATVVLFVAAWIATAAGSRSAEHPRPYVRSPHGARIHRRAAANRVLLSASSLEELDRVAEAHGTSRDQLIRTAVAEYLASEDEPAS
jgi:membrane protein